MLFLAAFALLQDPMVSGYVEQLTRKLAPRVAVAITVDERPRAEIADGAIGITTGLIAGAQSEAELAGILAHEAAHREAGGTCVRFSTAEPVQFQQAKEAEREADRIAIAMLTRAGYEPMGMLRYFSRIRHADQAWNKAFSAEDILLERLQLEATDHPLKDPLVDTAEFRMVRERVK